MTLDRIARATIHKHISEFVYYTIQSCATGHEIVENVVRLSQEKGGRNEDISSTTPLQPLNEGIQFGQGTLERLRRHNLLDLSTGNDDRRRD